MDEPQQSPPGDPPPREWLTAHRDRVILQLGAARALEARWSWARLATFTAAAIAWYPLREAPAFAVATVLMLFAGFVYSVTRHRLARRRRTFAERLLTVTDEALQRCGGKVVLIRSWQRPARDQTHDSALPPVLNRGRTWTLQPQEHDDLDLYAAPVGIFGLLNRTSTQIGARRLSEDLEASLMDPASLRERQQAVRWLDEHAGERLRLAAAAAGLRGQDKHLRALSIAIKGAKPLPWSPATVRSLRAWSVLTLAFTIFTAEQIFNGRHQWLTGLTAVLLINGAIYVRLAGALTTTIAPWRSLKKVTERYLHVARQGAADLPHDTQLGHLRNHFEAVAAVDVLPRLCRRLGWTDSGGFFHVLMNVFLFYDLHVAAAICRRVLPHREALTTGLSALADLEALSSLACFAYEQPLTCYPEPAKDDRIEIEHGTHPLIAPESAVANDLQLSADRRTWIITGSNMAGKSTFLRMVGVNVLLAQIGTAATARHMTLSPVRLITDLRIRDDLSKDESYFLAEVRQLRRMICAEGHPSLALGLIDEPFRGTNSQERVAASVALVEHLLDSPDFFLLATHEQTLTGLVEDKPAANYHFQEQLGADGETFDHRLRTGPASQRNALRLLEREGYPPSMVARANEWIKNSGA